jgi:hypothetical protein
VSPAAQIRPTQQRAGVPSCAPGPLLCQEAGVSPCAPGRRPGRAPAARPPRRPQPGRTQQCVAVGRRRTRSPRVACQACIPNTRCGPKGFAAPEVAHKSLNVRQNGDAGSLAGLGLLRPEDRFSWGARHPARRDSPAAGVASRARRAHRPGPGRCRCAALTSAVSFETLGSDVGDHAGTSESRLECMFACAGLFPGRRIRGSARGICTASGAYGASPTRPRRHGGA